jgi:exosortase/archaeosortase family protein
MLPALRSRYFDLSFFLRFLPILLFLHYFHSAFLGVTSPEGRYYFAVLDHYVNYISWLRLSILHASNILVHIWGIDAYLNGSQMISVVDGPSINVWLPCLGLDIMSFWVAFICAHPITWRKKLNWCMAGLLSIWILNCFRIAILLTALNGKWDSGGAIDHHDLFNLFSYAVILAFIFLFSKKERKEKETGLALA